MKSLRFGAAAVVLVLLGGVGMWLWLQPSAPPAHRVFVNANVLTMDAVNRVAAAVSVRHDRIEAVGTNAEIRRLITAETVVADLGGRTLLPGFIDAHGHFPGSGVREIMADLQSPPVGSVRSLADVEAALSGVTSGKDKGEWLFGFGYDDTLLADKRHPTRADLDRVSTGHPIFVMHVSGHMGVANSAALQELGVDATTPDPVGGVIVKDPVTGEPTGLLQETAALAAQNRMTNRSVSEGLAVLRSAVAEYAAVGVTTAQSGAVDAAMLQRMYWASRLGLIPLRLVVWPEHERMGDTIRAGRFDREAHRTDLFEVGAMKLVADGSIQGYTGYLTRPYHSPYAGDAEYRGYPTLERDELIRLVREYREAGWQLAIHGNGDAAIDDILDAVAAAQAALPDADARTILVHAQMARDDQLDRMKLLAVTPTFFSAHTWYWGDRHWDIFMGPERARRMSPTRSAAERGLRFSVHLDTPVVPMNPLLLVWSTVNRISTGGRVIGAEQRLAPMEALRAVTIDAAWQIRHEDDRGSIEAGKLADLVVLSGNPLDDPAAIRDIDVVETFVGGRSIFAANEVRER
jgi:predicted amidohydrolase YtcJ